MQMGCALKIRTAVFDCKTTFRQSISDDMRVRNWENKSFSGLRPLINGTFIFFSEQKSIAKRVLQLPVILLFKELHYGY